MGYFFLLNWTIETITQKENIFKISDQWKNTNKTLLWHKIPLTQNLMWMFWFIIKWGRFLINQVEDYQQIATQGSASREATHRKYLLFYFVYWRTLCPSLQYLFAFKQKRTSNLLINVYLRTFTKGHHSKI